MSIARLRSVCTEDAVPKGEIESIVRVSLISMNRVVYPVHVGSDQKQTNKAVLSFRDGDI